MLDKIDEQIQNLKTQQKNTEVLYNKLSGAIEALESLKAMPQEKTKESSPAKKSKK